ncbi:MAG: hypothetical protein V1721_07270 [Pseudomonadota bacterium]
MKSSLKSALDNLEKSLGRLETTVEKRFISIKKQKEEPQLDLSARNEREVTRKIATRLDQTINRLERLLTEEKSCG